MPARLSVMAVRWEGMTNESQVRVELLAHDTGWHDYHFHTLVSFNRQIALRSFGAISARDKNPIPLGNINPPNQGGNN
jgi:hypothetical protein